MPLGETQSQGHAFCVDSHLRPVRITRQFRQSRQTDSLVLFPRENKQTPICKLHPFPKKTTEEKLGEQFVISSSNLPLSVDIILLEEALCLCVLNRFLGTKEGHEISFFFGLKKKKRQCQGRWRDFIGFNISLWSEKPLQNALEHTAGKPGQPPGANPSSAPGFTNRAQQSQSPHLLNGHNSSLAS